MVVGNWGTKHVFQVSDFEAIQLQNLSRTVSAEWANHSRIGLKDQPEFLRPGLDKFSFTAVFDATLGVSPRAMLDAFAESTAKGEVNPLVIGGIRVGKHSYKIESISETWNYFLPRGELLRATATISMSEYL